MRHKFLLILGIAGLVATLATSGQGQLLVDLSNPNITGGEINGALYLTDMTEGSGSGIFGKDSAGCFSSIQNVGVQEGYNTSAKNIMDSNRVPTYSHEIKLGQMGVATVNNKDYITFLLDINESNKAGECLLTLDDVKIFTTTATAITNPTVESLMSDSRLTLRYSMDTATVNNTVLLDFNRLGTGSGGSDMGLFVPVSYFNGVLASENLYIYSKFGGDLSVGSAEAGAEEWTARVELRQIPEPTSFSLICLSGAGFFFRRRRPSPQW